MNFRKNLLQFQHSDIWRASELVLRGILNLHCFENVSKNDTIVIVIDFFSFENRFVAGTKAGHVVIFEETSIENSKKLFENTDK